MKTATRKPGRSRLAVVVLGVFAPLVLPAAPADAYDTFNNRRLNGGISDGRYFIDSTAGGAVDVAAVTRANDLWVGSPTAYYFTRQSVDVHSKAVFHRNAGTSGLINGFCARTYLYAAGATIDPTSSNWSWGEVHLDPTNFTNAGACGSQTDQHRGAIIAHEWGHLVGLAHSSNPAVLMYTYIAGTGITGPTTDDVAGVNSLY